MENHANALVTRPERPVNSLALSPPLQPPAVDLIATGKRTRSRGGEGIQAPASSPPCRFDVAFEALPRLRWSRRLLAEKHAEGSDE